MQAVPTGEACPYCGAKEWFVPGYLAKREDGSRFFTVARETHHRAVCDRPES